MSRRHNTSRMSRRKTSRIRKTSRKSRRKTSRTSRRKAIGGEYQDYVGQSVQYGFRITVRIHNNNNNNGYIISIIKYQY